MKSYNLIKYSGLYAIPYLWAIVSIQDCYEVETVQMVQIFVGFDPANINSICSSNLNHVLVYMQDWIFNLFFVFLLVTR